MRYEAQQRSVWQPGHKLEVETANHKYGQMVADERQSLRSIARDPERAVRRGYYTTTV